MGVCVCVLCGVSGLLRARIIPNTNPGPVVSFLDKQRAESPSLYSMLGFRKIAETARHATHTTAAATFYASWP